MSNDPDEGQNPFKGTPFEQFFNALGGGAGGTGGLGFNAAPGQGAGGAPDLGALFS